MQVLQALAELTVRENGSSLGAVAQAVNSGRRPPISSNWVYKCLQSLQDRGLLTADLLQRPSVYRTDSTILEKGVVGLVAERLRHLARERGRLESELDLLKSASPHEMAEHLMGTLSGRPPEPSREVLMGSQKVLDVMVRQLNPLGAAKGSTVRFMQGLDAIVGLRLNSTRFEHSVLEAIRRGVAVRAILFPYEVQGNPEEGLVRFMGTVGPSLVDALESGTLRIRLFAGKGTTYRMMSIDDHTMVMFLTTSYIPDAAILLKSVDDSGLIGDAVRTFEEKWEISADLNDSILALLKPGSHS